MKLLPYAVLALVVYCGGLPICAGLFLRARKNAVKYDQLLRVKGLGDDRRTNPRFYNFRKMWHKLYYHFVPGKWYWEAIILARKFLIAFTSLMFRSTPSYQLSMALLVLFVAYVLQVRGRPYITHTNKQQVVDEHLRKVLAGNELHRTIEAEMREVGRVNNRVGGKAANPDWRAFGASSREKLSPADVALHSAFDYNTVEAVLLASAVLVNLAGISELQRLTRHAHIRTARRQ